MAKVPPEAQQHPEAFEEVVAIARAGSYAHLNAVTQIGPLFDALFDGGDAQGRSTWIGASLRVEDFCSHVPGTSRPRLYAETFWGSDDKGVVPSFAVLDSGRPVLLAVVPFNGPVPAAAADENVAKVLAVRLAEQRSLDL